MVSTVVPPVQLVAGDTTAQSAKVTEPVGAPPAVFPVTVAASFHELPIVVEAGVVMAVVKLFGVAMAVSYIGWVLPSKPAAVQCEVGVQLTS
jgi:hypothetical protein